MKRNRWMWRRAVLLCVLAALLAGCTGGGPDTPESSSTGAYPIPAFQDATFNADQATVYSDCQVDFSTTADGYLALTAQSDQRLKFRISCGEMVYTFNLAGKGKPEILPLTMGSGLYTFQLLENVEGNKYTCLWEESREIAIKDEFQPFLRPSLMVPYREDSECVALAKKLAGKCDTDAEVVSAIYKYIQKNITYDTEKATTVQSGQLSGYLSDPDKTLSSGAGICFDYACLAASMMRSMGIPCKMIFGNVHIDESDIYHAWNTFYLEGQGWITAQIKANPNTWQRVDITFAAGGVDAETLMDDNRYTGQLSY